MKRLKQLKIAFERGCRIDPTLRERVTNATSYQEIIALLTPYDDKAVSKPDEQVKRTKE